MRYRSWATVARSRTRVMRSDQRLFVRRVFLLCSATALLAAGTASAGFTTRAGGQVEGEPAPVAPGDLLASTGNMGASLIDVDPSTGEGSLRFPLGEFGGVTEIVYRADGTLYGTTGGGASSLIIIDPDTGDETLVDMHEFGAVNGLEFVNCTLYGTYFAPPGPTLESGGDTPTFLVTVDPETAELSPIGEVGFSPVRGLAYDPTSGVLYGAAPAVIDEVFVDSALLTIDLETGAGTVVGPIGHAVGALRFGPDGVLYGGTVEPAFLGEGEALLITVDPATGAGTPVGGTGFPAISGLAFVPQLLVPDDLEVDFSSLASDGNGVFEPGETVEAAPFWRNNCGDEVFADGILSNFTGPEGATYDVVFNGVAYAIPPGTSGSCQDSSDCYELEIQITGTERPAIHWDATVDEELTTGPSDSVTQTWTLHVGDSFTDVPRTNLFYPSVETLLHSGVTGGCVGSQFCPGGVTTRSQMPVFMLRALEGPDYVPPACVEGEEAFDDVPFDSTFCPWITDLFDRGVVNGCGTGVYCPGDPVSRAQMAIFLLKTLEGSAYEPPECTEMFDDVPCPSLFADWIEDLASRGITSGCGGDNFCPSAPVSRAQMASFIVRTFGLTLYGP